jgi:hypothetical protein
MKLFIVFFFLLTNQIVLAQSLAINTDGSIAHGSAIFDVKSDNKGLLLPRMTKAQKNAIATPATGLLVFQTAPDSIGFHYYNGLQWLWLDPFVSNAWKTTGNTGTDTAVNFIGTLDNMPIKFKQQNQQVALWNKNSGNYFFGADAGNNDLLLQHNIAIGNQSLTSNNFGASNISIGRSALQDNTDGGSNTAIGGFALLSNTTGFFNTSVGSFAGTLNKTGFQNTFIGASANFGSGIDSLVNATAIGYSAHVDTSNALILGNGANVGIGTSKPKAALHISRGNYGGSLPIPSSRTLLMEDNVSSYIQLLHPAASETGILAGNETTLVKSGVVFLADSSIQIRTGGNNTRVWINKLGNVGINTLPFIPRSMLDVNGSFGNASRVVTTSPTLNENDHTIIVDNTVTLPFVINLPLANTVVNREYVLVNQAAVGMITNFAYQDFTGTNVNTVPANASITLQSVAAVWQRIR